MEILASRVLFRPADYDRSVAFYRDGLDLAIAREYPGGTVFYAGQSLIEIAGHGSPADGAPPFPGALWLQVRDLEVAQNTLRQRGIHITRDARREAWGLSEMHVQDPDGVTLIFVEVPDDHPLRRDTRG
ncbi:VOC family protein [Mycolicibacterium sp. 018/SC-01/001]|uniref:VOC family protein n=1 Tax=Mycolicibacterium sp. 018/SC-01/001 TaxID=2592069 RepID=UPI00117E80CE|nr:VOC family protein [Mycolicibacterium sp. 018/SC-01/001]TRW86341.1 VOC family protein [Mycolicibacterium sp. 018/SC-01/001]